MACSGLSPLIFTTAEALGFDDMKAARGFVERPDESVSTRRINALRNTPGRPVWQRNYYEHIIRNEASLQRIRRYIVNNPARWHEDNNHPGRT